MNRSLPILSFVLTAAVAHDSAHGTITTSLVGRTVTLSSGNAPNEVVGTFDAQLGQFFITSSTDQISGPSSFLTAAFDTLVIETKGGADVIRITADPASGPLPELVVDMDDGADQLEISSCDIISLDVVAGGGADELLVADGQLNFVTFVTNGGTDSVEISNCLLGDVDLNTGTDADHILIASDITALSITADSGADQLVIGNGEYGSVNIQMNGGLDSVEISGGGYDSLSVSAGADADHVVIEDVECDFVDLETGGGADYAEISDSDLDALDASMGSQADLLIISGGQCGSAAIETGAGGDGFAVSGGALVDIDLDTGDGDDCILFLSSVITGLTDIRMKNGMDVCALAATAFGPLTVSGGANQEDALLVVDNLYNNPPTVEEVELISDTYDSEIHSCLIPLYDSLPD